MSEGNDLKGLTAVVTGGSRGIGKGIVRSLAEAGASVVIMGRGAADLEQAVADLTAEGHNVVGMQGDTAVEADCERAVNEAVSGFGGLDLVCCNAGIFPTSKLDDLPLKELQDVLGVNLVGTMLMVKAALPQLRKSKCGRVVVTSSITGAITAIPDFTSYAASKAGQLGFVRAAALELASAGITVNAILPGNILTEGLKELGPDYAEAQARTIPVGKLGQVSDIGNAAAFFCSPKSHFITGQALVVDGGQILPESLG